MAKKKNNSRLATPTAQQVDLVVAELQQFLKHEYSSLKFDASTTFSELHRQFYSSIMCEGDCPLELLCDVAHHFDLQIYPERWGMWLQIRDRETDEWMSQFGDHTTVRDLAYYLARRIRWTSFEPATIFGNRCAPAGAFLGLRDLLVHKSFAPSTPIRKKLRRGDIHKLLQKVQWMTGYQPEMPKDEPAETQAVSPWVGTSLLFFAIIAAFIATPVFDLRPVLAIFGSVFLLILSLVFYGCLVDALRHPIPKRIRTFGDLAREIAVHINK